MSTPLAATGIATNVLLALGAGLLIIGKGFLMLSKKFAR